MQRTVRGLSRVPYKIVSFDRIIHAVSGNGNAAGKDVFHAKAVPLSQGEIAFAADIRPAKLRVCMERFSKVAWNPLSC